MKNFVITLFFLFFCARGFCQFNGGSSDGYGKLESDLLTLNNQVVYASGGSGDGYSRNSYSGFTGSQSLYCSGGSGEGYSRNSYSGLAGSQSMYCSGGSGDGYSRNSFSGLAGSQSLYCSCGSGDGYSRDSYSGFAGSQSLYCSGGSGDGYSRDSYSGFAGSQSLYCSGGSGDGYSRDSYSGFAGSQLLYCAGGSADGYSRNSYSGFAGTQSNYCYGGSGDGYSNASGTLTPMGSGIWKGIISNNWSNAGNWINNTVPDSTLNVIIPAGCLYYPSLSGTLSISSASGTYRTKNLEIRDGSSITNTGSLSVYGTMNIAGSYVANNTSSLSQQVFSGGTLTIRETGSVRLGNQSSGSGLCDLVVNSGGTLNVSNGILEVDDQLNILSGGSFNMTGGIVFAHKFGKGSAYSVSEPGSFYVASGASGSISGGFIKVAGKATVSSYTAVSINSSAFDFTGTSSLVFTDGVNITADDVECRTAAGAYLHNLLVDRPGRIVTIGSDAIFSGNVTVNPAFTLMVKPGMNVTVNGTLNLLP